MKAMGVGVGACKWREIEVVRAPLGPAVGRAVRRRRRTRRAQGRDGLAAQPHPHRVDGRSGRCRTLTASSAIVRRMAGRSRGVVGHVVRSAAAGAVRRVRGRAGRRTSGGSGPAGSTARLPAGHRDRRGSPWPPRVPPRAWSGAVGTATCSSTASTDQRAHRSAPEGVAVLRDPDVWTDLGARSGGAGDGFLLAVRPSTWNGIHVSTTRRVPPAHRPDGRSVCLAGGPPSASARAETDLLRGGDGRGHVDRIVVPGRGGLPEHDEPVPGHDGRGGHAGGDAARGPTIALS